MNEQLRQIEEQLNKIGTEWGRISPLPDQIKTLDQAIAGMRVDIDHIRRARLTESDVREPGKMSRRGAELLGAAVVRHLERRGVLPEAIGDAAKRQAQLKDCEAAVQRWTGQTVSEFPLPSTYSAEIDALIPDYGVVRRIMTPWPLSGGTDKPPRHTTGMAFGSIAINTAFTEKNPAFTFASLESHKLGGVVITPRELFEQSIVDIGMYLGLLAAKEFARCEDLWTLLADGTATYESTSGVSKIAVDNSYYVAMSAGNTAPADMTLANLRATKAKVSTAAFSRGVWLMNPTFQAYLPDLNTEANQYAYRELPDGSVRVLGHPVIWCDVLQAYTEDAAASTTVALFGDFSWWWFAKRPNGPRIDTSDQVLFTADQIATRFIEEIDYDYRALAAVAALRTAAA